MLGLLGLKRRKDTYTSSRPVAADETPRGVNVRARLTTVPPGEVPPGAPLVWVHRARDRAMRDGLARPVASVVRHEIAGRPKR